MQTSEKDLASFARHHGHALESSDPQAVLDAEANLATVVNAEWLERLKVDIGLRFPRALTVLRHLKTAVGGKAPSNPFADCNLDVIGHAIAFLRNPASEDSDERDACLRWTNGPVRAANLDARNEVAASWCLTPLKSISLIEEAMRHESRLDWGQVGLGFGPYLEDVLRSCMFDVGRQAWEPRHAARTSILLAHPRVHFREGRSTNARLLRGDRVPAPTASRSTRDVAGAGPARDAIGAKLAVRGRPGCV